MFATRVARRSTLLVAVLAAATGVSACDASPDRSGAVSVAQSFVTALERHDGGAACALLTGNAKSAATGATDESCPTAVSNVREDGTTVGGAQAWGDAAQVHIGNDVLFLRRVTGRWLVSAAGCTRQPAGPYDCEIGG